MNYSSLKLGRYTIIKKLAVGGMAELFHAKISGPAGFEKHVALKRILPHYASNPEFRKMFEYEAKLSRYLKHTNIVQTRNFVELGQTYLLELEFIHGVNLKQLMTRLAEMNERITVQWAVHVIKEVCSGLDYAHNRKDDGQKESLHIIHRDMSPQNIMIAFNGAVKIVDFGIAKARNEADHTQTGVIKGKFAYMSPEQASGEDLDARTDIFSVGINLWELLTGHRLFARDNDLATLKQVMEGIIPKPSALNPDVPEVLDTIVLKALARSKKDRFQSAAELRNSLQAFLSTYSPHFSATHLPSHLERLFVAETQKERVKVSNVATKVSNVSMQSAPAEYSGDVFYEASESSITHFRNTDEEEKNTDPTFEIRKTVNPIEVFEAQATPSMLLPRESVAARPQNWFFIALFTIFTFFPTPERIFSLKSPTLAEKPTPKKTFVRLLVDEDVSLFVKKKKIAEAKAGIPITVSLPGGKKHTVEFRNNKRRIQTTRVIDVKSGFINHVTVSVK